MTWILIAAAWIAFSNGYFVTGWTLTALAILVAVSVPPKNSKQEP